MFDRLRRALLRDMIVSGSLSSRGGTEKYYIIAAEAMLLALMKNTSSRLQEDIKWHADFLKLQKIDLIYRQNQQKR